MWFSIDSLPVYAVFVILTLVSYLAFEIGFSLSLRLYGGKKKSEIPNFGQVSAGLVGMLAFVLAFTFSMAATQFTHRKEMVLKEANAIGTAYLRGDLLDELSGSKLKQTLRDYVDVRLEGTEVTHIENAINKSQEIHKKIWSLASKAAKNSPNTNTSLVVQAVNDVIDIHEERLTAAIRDKIPNSIWITLIVISVLAMVSLGIETGISGSRKLIAIIPLILALAALMSLIADLNRPQEGSLKVSQEVMLSLQKSIRENL